MHAAGKDLELSATDLSNFLSCRHRTALEMAAAHGSLKKPMFDDPMFRLLLARGLEHEKKYVKSLRSAGHDVVDLSDVPEFDVRVQRTLEAMRARADVIVQGALRDGRWRGYPDMIQRVDAPSTFGKWSYEISDTKLARETRSGTILQLSLYSEMLDAAQGSRPEHFYVVTPDPEAPVHKYRVNDYAAYFRFVRDRMLEVVAMEDDAVAAANYPEPVEHCEICPWCMQCKDRWRVDDHLSLVAGISRLQRRELEEREVLTLTAITELALPLPFKPNRGSADTYVRVHHQARLQLHSRGKTPPIHELREIAEGCGLCRLPEPSPGDIFLDLEGDPFAAEGGREYLFGLVTVDASGNQSYRAYWAFTEQEERVAFEAVMDAIGEALKSNDSMHVYHYAPYEPSAFKRLMGRYASREQELDRLLRSEKFVDLYGVVRQGLRAGVERYSIKNLEPLYGFERAVDLGDARRNLSLMEQALELRCTDALPQEVRDTVEGYNKDDCISTLQLREWLERVRAAAIAEGKEIARPIPMPPEASEEVDQRARRVAELRARLLSGVSEARAERSEDEHARWLLAYMLDWHRREDKAGWWEYFRLCALPEEDLLDEPEAIAGLVHLMRVGFVPHVTTGDPTRSVIDRYQYPLQEMEIGRGDRLKLQDDTHIGKVEQVDRLAKTIDIRKGPSQANTHPRAVFAHTHINTGVLEESLLGIGDSVAADGAMSVDRPASYAAARELLLARPPRLPSGEFVIRSGESVGDFAVRVAGDLDESVLAIQGPPGSGKTYTGARMILGMVGQGKRVGVTGPSHKVIRNLLEAVAKAAAEAGVSVKLVQKVEDDAPGADSLVTTVATNEEALEALTSGEAQVLGGTAWLWARPEFAAAVDVLFVDEAGQMSLANTLAVSRAAKSLVLLGDPQQLDQPLKGSHPEGVNASALQHILGEHQTIPADRGIFLPVTWRLCPNICSFTSELFYEGRLESNAGLEHQRLTGVAALEGSGLWLLEVEHGGNRNSSLEEVEAVADLFGRLTAPGSRWIDEHGTERQITANDVLIVAPYNAHVTRLEDRLGKGARVGTVDKFQGQEAPVAIYSMATSRPEDAPRGMSFLYNLNRLNVATSRARCAAILVVSPRLFEPECRTPRQMKLANALCRYREMATPVAAIQSSVLAAAIT